MSEITINFTESDIERLKASYEDRTDLNNNKLVFKWGAVTDKGKTIAVNVTVGNDK